MTATKSKRYLLNLPRIEADEDKVLAALAAHPVVRAWSSLAAEIHGIDYIDVGMPHVRGVRDACHALAAQGLILEGRGAARIFPPDLLD